VGLETTTYINGLIAANPVGTDDQSQGDDHIRLIKSAIKNTFPNITGAITPTQIELNVLAGGLAAGEVTNTPAGNITATNVQTAINELDAEKLAIDGDGSGLTGITGIRVSSALDMSALLSGSQTSLVVPDVIVGVDTTFVSITGSTLALGTAGNWDVTSFATAANRAGKDFYLYALEAGGVVLSNNSTTPTGYTATNSRKIGGFHCLAVAVGTIIGHTLTGYLAGDILPLSVWDRFNRSSARQEGTILSSSGVWVDIYLPSVSGTTLVSVNNGTIADGSSSPAFHAYKFEQWFGRQKMKSISQLEFVVASIGANQGTNITGSADPSTTTGHVDTAGRRMVSDEGVEDTCGVMLQWSRDQGGGQTAAPFANAYDANDAGVGGQHYTAPNRARLGGYWANNVICGSRSSIWNNSPLVLSATFGSRGVAEPASSRF